jgi:phosphoglycerol transferase MdoB-like AlkP superfamily enzyme
MRKHFKKLRSKSKDSFHNILDKIKYIWHTIILFFKEKGKWRKIKRLISNIHKFLKRKHIYSMLLFIIIYLTMSISTKIFAKDIGFSGYDEVIPKLFTIGYISLFLGIIYSLKRKYAMIANFVIFIVFSILFLVNNVYFDATKNFFSFSMLELASEGSSYMMDVIKNCNILVYIVFIVIIALFVILVKHFPKNRKFNKKLLFISIIIFIVCHSVAVKKLGKGNVELTWDSWNKPKNVYNNFNDSNKCMVLTGFFEYSIRDFYVVYLKPEESRTATENNFLEDAFSDHYDDYSKNKYTGRFKGKNVIFLQFEGIDDWLLTKELMPNTYSLLDHSINFTNHYSFYNGGGSTFNSEFAVNIGYMTPFTYPINAYTLNKNDFPYSMPNLMKQYDYSIKAFHMNSGEYYSRSINYQNFGYDQYFGLKDLGGYKDEMYQLDRELILNETFYNEMFKGSDKFVNYIITYSNHLPFTTDKAVCRKLVKKDYQDKLSKMSSSEQDEFIKKLNMGEMDCIKRQAKETDYMVGLLMKALKDNGLYDDTIIVAFTDHYLYTVSSNDILAPYKDVNTNLINHTPFFIWSSKTKKQEIKKVTSQLNILPTFLNLMGVKYNEKWYVERDALDKNYSPLTIFSDLSWYDGNIYVVDGEVKNKGKVSKDDLEKKNNYVEYLIKKNDLVLKYNYFKELK